MDNSHSVLGAPVTRPVATGRSPSPEGGVILTVLRNGRRARRGDTQVPPATVPLPAPPRRDADLAPRPASSAKPRRSGVLSYEEWLEGQSLHSRSPESAKLAVT